jgi:serine/threonine protein kinase
VARFPCFCPHRSRSIIHRDLKSHNLLVTKDFGIKVADFGLTIVHKHAQPVVEETVAAGEGMVATGGMKYGVLGTPQWMAPEVMEGQSYTWKVDVYSFGIVLCELFSRIVPFSGAFSCFCVPAWVGMPCVTPWVLSPRRVSTV